MSHTDTLRNVYGTSLSACTRRIVQTYNRATGDQLREGAGWYAKANALAEDLVEQSGHDRETVAAVIAHLSPRTPWRRNVAAARAALLGTALPGGILGRNLDGAYRAMASDTPLATLTGPKTRRFALNILGYGSVVTVDVWALRVALGLNPSQSGLQRVGVYDALEAAYRNAARILGIDPAVVQATTWVVLRGSAI